MKFESIANSRKAQIGFWMAALSLLVVACGEDEPERFAAEGQPTRGIWVTFVSVGEQFSALVVLPDEMNKVLRWAESGTQQRELSGRVARAQEFNAPYSWSLFPESVVFAEVEPQVPDECRTPPRAFEASGAWLRCSFYSPRDVQIQSALDCRSGACVEIGQPRPTPTATVTASPTPTPTVTVTSSPTPTPTVTVTTTPSPAPYDPCAGKACGDRCTLCRPGDPDCVETAVLKECNAAGTCVTAPAACS